jgi:acyl-coenzyme A synthetase/AMP-(fatty) acid ligase
MRLPLIPPESAQDLSRPIAFVEGVPISVAQFLSQADALAKLLPAGLAVLNLAQSRYHFLLGFTAALLRGQVTLMPASHTAETLRELQLVYPDYCCLTDVTKPSIELPCLIIDPASLSSDQQRAVPSFPAEQLAAVVFTSGSTGKPVGHRKHFGQLVYNAQSQALRLGMRAEEPSTLVGTVPVQHMYGFESTFLVALMSGHAFAAERPFYPADIAQCLAKLPVPRVLITTPAHLRVLVDAELPYPTIASLMCATAPLSPVLALAAEQCFNAPLYEIYGCTEAGQLATRRTTLDSQWETYRGVCIEQQGSHWVASGGHVEGSVPLGDILHCLDASHFELLGRSADMINIAGKRTSLAYLNHHLQSIKGVQDAAFYLPASREADVVPRLCAFVVTGLAREHLLTELRDKIDPVFLPRPLIYLPSLPRNDTGKLTQAALDSLYQQHAL